MTRGPLVRTDIQALRALAVGVVLLFHLWPNRLPGGFVGVDVFFVISGFLITSHLLAHPPSSGRDLANFWARRIRRLLPASLLVLGCTLLASRVIGLETQWERTARHVMAAAGYFVNWLLAQESVDYLAADSAPSPVLHFWSLSVEEQFYLGWPVLVMLLFVIARLVRVKPNLVVVTGLGGVAGASLAFSVARTASDPAAAYFITSTRIWELGAGGLLAALLSRRAFGRDADHEHVALPPIGRSLLAWAGLGTIAVVSFTYTGATPFPGWQALLPVLGAVALIAVDAPRGVGSPSGLMALRPVQFLGDISYSVYLWHWPIVVLLPAATNHPLTTVDKLGVLAATLVLATLTKYFVEDVFRTARWNQRLFTTYALGAVAMAVVIGGSVVQVHEVQHREQMAREKTERALAEHDPCLGAGFLDPANHCPETTGEPIPSPALAAKDKSDAYSVVSGGKDCWSYLRRFPQVSCDFGKDDADLTVALVGNSHAGQWLPALQELAPEQDFRIRTYLASRCAMSDVRQQFDTADFSSACHDWVAETRDRVIADHPDLVVLSNRSSVPVEGRTFEESARPYAKGYQRVLEAWADAGISVLVIRDTPASVDAGAPAAPDCVADNPDDYAVCSGDRGAWEPDDPVIDAVHALDDRHVRLVDLNDRICSVDTCSAVVGGVIVYFDGSHLTATYATTLAPFLAPKLERALDGATKR